MVFIFNGKYFSFRSKSQRLEILIAESALDTHPTKSPSTKRARKVLLPKVEEDTTESKLVMVVNPSLFSERRQRQPKLLH